MDYRDENNEWQEIILEPSGDTLPIGAITQFGGETAPTNWLFCNGQAVSRETYAELFEAIGTTYGDGDGSTTFNVPDFIGRVPVGLDAEDTDFDTLGETGGSKDLQEHSHTVPLVSVISPQGGGTDPNYAVIAKGSTQNSGSTGTGDSGNLQPYTVTNFIIKAKQSIGIVGNISEDITDTNDNAVPTCETVKDYVDSKEKAIIECMLSSTPSPTTGSYIDVNNLEIINGKNYDGKFSISNGKVVIGNGVSKIKVTRIINITTTSGSGWTTVYSYLRKNSSSVNNSWLYVDAPAIRTVVGISEDIVDVEENDIISFSTYCDLGYNINKNATKMIIEEI